VLADRCGVSSERDFIGLGDGGFSGRRRCGSSRWSLAKTSAGAVLAPSLRWRSFCPGRHPRLGLVLPRVLLLPLPMSEPARTVCL
jgi:hypothetical protein